MYLSGALVCAFVYNFQYMSINDHGTIHFFYINFHFSLSLWIPFGMEKEFLSGTKNELYSEKL